MGFMKKFRDDLNASLERFRKDVQEAVNKAVGYATKAAEKATENIYRMLGVPEGVLATPAMPTEVRPDGFRFQGIPGATFYWMAIGPAFELELPKVELPSIT